MKDFRIKVTSIDSAWQTCNYKFRVFIENEYFSVERHNYILDTLKKWFGDAEFFWNDGNSQMFLCCKK